MATIQSNIHLTKEILSAETHQFERLSAIRNYYKSLRELTDNFKNHPIDSGYSESEWREIYEDIRQTIMSIPDFENKYPYHTGVLREILAKTPLSFPE